MKELIDILNGEITAKEKLLESKEVLINLEKIFQKFKKDLNSLSKKDIMFISDLFSRIEYAKLKSLYDFINDIKEMNDGILLLNEEDLQLVDVVLNRLNSKINDLKNNNFDTLNSEINKLKEWIIKLSNCGEELITNEDMTSILEILKRLNVQEEIISKIFLGIAYHNEKIFNNYITNKKEIDLEEIESETLIKTNLNKQELLNIFSKYNIEIEEEYLSDLCTYGNLELIKEKLDILKDNYQFHIFKNSYVLSRILLYTSKEDLIKLMEFNKKYNLTEVLIKYPTIYYRKIKSSIGKNGSLDNFFKNMQFLEDNNFDIRKVKDKCPIFFTFSNKTVLKNYEILKIYGIDFTSDESYTFLNAPHLDSSIDLFIESGLFNYACENKSRLMQGGDLICARVKYAKKLKDLNLEHGCDYPYRMYTSVDGKKMTLKKEFIDKKETIYGSSVDETYRLYDKVTINEENTDIYDKIVKGSSPNSVTNISLTNKTILLLDELFKESKLVYNFNGVKISRIKVLRLLETFIMTPNIIIDAELLRYIITYNSIIDHNELEIINECIKKLGLEDVR